MHFHRQPMLFSVHTNKIDEKKRDSVEFPMGNLAFTPGEKQMPLQTLAKSTSHFSPSLGGPAKCSASGFGSLEPGGLETAIEPDTAEGTLHRDNTCPLFFSFPSTCLFPSKANRTIQKLKQASGRTPLVFFAQRSVSPKPGQIPVFDTRDTKPDFERHGLW